MTQKFPKALRTIHPKWHSIGKNCWFLSIYRCFMKNWRKNFFLIFDQKKSLGSPLSICKGKNGQKWANTKNCHILMCFGENKKIKKFCKFLSKNPIVKRVSHPVYPKIGFHQIWIWREHMLNVGKQYAKRIGTFACEIKKRIKNNRRTDRQTDGDTYTLREM